MDGELVVGPPTDVEPAFRVMADPDPRAMLAIARTVFGNRLAVGFGRGPQGSMSARGDYGGWPVELRFGEPATTPFLLEVAHLGSWLQVGKLPAGQPAGQALRDPRLQSLSVWGAPAAWVSLVFDELFERRLGPLFQDSLPDPRRALAFSIQAGRVHLMTSLWPGDRAAMEYLLQFVAELDMRSDWASQVCAPPKVEAPPGEPRLGVRTERPDRMSMRSGQAHDWATAHPRHASWTPDTVRVAIWLAAFVVLALVATVLIYLLTGPGPYAGH